MTENAAAIQTTRFVSDLRTVPALAKLPEAELTWAAERMDELRMEAGEVFGRDGEVIEYMAALIEGEVQIIRSGSPMAPVFMAYAGEVTGALPFSRLKNFRGTARAVARSRMLRLHKRHFPELLQNCPELSQCLVSLMSDRVREVTRMETQQEKLMALGKLSAGLAHELNNPAAAARRSAQGLMGALENVRDVSMRLLRHASTEEQRNAIFEFELAAGKKACEADESDDPLALSDREEQITAWLEAHGVQEVWKVARVLAEAEITESELDGLEARIGADLVGDALHRVAAIVSILCLITEINNSTQRVSELVTAIKRYSYMDQTPIQEINLQDDLENTLKIFGHRLKKGITVIRKYELDLPRVCAYGSELNQLWTNLIDNAIDAMNGSGELRVCTHREIEHVTVEIGDNGPGIPPEIQSRIFEPFFTTKKMGEGTGMGLDTVARIVRTHHGQIEVESTPGDTVFRVRLPLKQPKVEQELQQPETKP